MWWGWPTHRRACRRTPASSMRATWPTCSGSWGPRARWRRTGTTRSWPACACCATASRWRPPRSSCWAARAGPAGHNRKEHPRDRFGGAVDTDRGVDDGDRGLSDDLRPGGLRRDRGGLEGPEHPAHALDVGLQRHSRHRAGGSADRHGRGARHAPVGARLPRRLPGHPQRGGWFRRHRPHARDVQVQAGRAVTARRQGAGGPGPGRASPRRRARRGHDRGGRLMLAVSFTLTTARDLAYLIAIAGFIIALKGLSSPRHARLGNLVGAAAATLAIAMTFTLPSLRHSGWNLVLALMAMALGAAIAVPVARFVKMTAMPQLVAIFNGVGGGAAALISIVELLHLHALGLSPAVYVTAEVLAGVLIGSVSFSGSAIAFIKLQELITGRPITYPGQQVINALVGIAIAVMIVLALVTGNIAFVWIILGLSLVLGVIFVLPIGGADVPVLISLLNSFTGLAVAASGFVLDNALLIVAGTLVGASGIILTRLMSAAMGRSLPNILFSAFGSVITATGGEAGDAARPVRTGTPDDVGVLLAYARKVVIIPGYGLAVAQAQHTARELEEALKARGVETFFAIHPVAGRMPGHMNVLLAEANVPYDELKEMEEANPEMQTADVALVVGANDTVNPAAMNTPGSPIYGMPIVHADAAKNVVFLKRSMRPGFAGIENELLYDPKTTMLFGDAKDTLQKLVAAVADA